MKSSVEIDCAHLKNLLSSVNRINAVPDEDVHADVHLRTANDTVELYSHVPPTFIIHTLETGGDVKVSVEEPGGISFNIETLFEIVRKTTNGKLKIHIEGNLYRVTTPEGESLSSVQFDLPRHTESLFEQPLDRLEAYKLGAVSRKELDSRLDTMGVIDEFVNISVKDSHEFTISIDNKVTGSANMTIRGCGPEIQSMSLYYLLRPLREFTRTLTDADAVSIFVTERSNLRLEANGDGWTSELYVPSSDAPHYDTFLNV